MIEERVSQKYLARIRELKQSHVLLDTHAHPFELFYGRLAYKRNSEREGVYSAGPVSFVPPRLVDIPAVDDERARKISAIFLRSGLAVFTLGRLYSHTGPAVFRTHMELSGIDRVLLLPVVRPQDDVDRQMVQMQEMFGGDEKFEFGWCVPESIPDDAVLPAARLAMRRFGIKAVKLHPNITGIDPRSARGRRRIEAIIRTCHILKLPLVVHGGKSPQLERTGSSAYAVAWNLSEIDWSLTDSPVVICHAGTYACAGSEFTRSLDTVNRLLFKHKNLLVDISALELAALVHVLRELDFERIIFGSDMLYESQWAMTVKLLLALESTARNPEEVFLKIASINPQKHILTK